MEDTMFELEDDDLCLCDSHRKYKNCCKKRGIQWLYDGKAKAIRRISVGEEIIESFQSLKERFTQLYGRDVSEHDHVFWSKYEDSNQHAKREVQLMRLAGIDEAMIYAYMESGVLIISENVHFTPPGYVKEFERYVKEYRKAMNEFPKDNQINVLLLVSVANDILQDLASKLKANLHDAYNYFIKKHLEGNKDFFHYEVNSILDYGGLCAMKTLNNLESIHKLAEHELEENVLSTSRSIFESYLYMVALNRSEEFFDEHILNANDAQPISIASLAKQSKYRQDRQLYSSFFRESSRFVHLDVLSARAYFKKYNPFTEINGSLIAYVIGITFSVLNLEQISMFKECDGQFRKDISYLVEHAKKDLLDAYQLIASIPSSQNAMYDKLKKRLEN